MTISRSDRSDEFYQDWPYDVKNGYFPAKNDVDFKFLTQPSIDSEIYLVKNIDLVWRWLERFLEFHPDICLRQFDTVNNLSFAQIKNEWNQERAYFYLAPKNVDDRRHFGEFEIHKITFR